MSAACPYCRGRFESPDGIRICQACATPHHQDCFTENGGCTVFGCVNAPGDEPKIRVLIEDLGDRPPAFRYPDAAAATAPASSRQPATLTVEAFQGESWRSTSQFGVLLERECPPPPNLPWELLLTLSLLSSGLFLLIWDLVLARWMREVHPQNRAIYYHSVAGILVLLAFAGAVGGRISDISATAVLLLGIAMVLLTLTGRFSMSTSLEGYFHEQGAIGFALSEGMTFVFGSIYFQYHLNRIVRQREERGHASRTGPRMTVRRLAEFF